MRRDRLAHHPTEYPKLAVASGADAPGRNNLHYLSSTPMALRRVWGKKTKLFARAVCSDDPNPRNAEREHVVYVSKREVVERGDVPS